MVATYFDEAGKVDYASNFESEVNVGEASYLATPRPSYAVRICALANCIFLGPV